MTACFDQRSRRNGWARCSFTSSEESNAQFVEDEVDPFLRSEKFTGEGVHFADERRLQLSSSFPQTTAIHTFKMLG